MIQDRFVYTAMQCRAACLSLQREYGNMKHMMRRICSQICIILALVAITGASFAWYGEIHKADIELAGSVTYVARYFESGDGSQPDEIVTGYDADGSPVFGKKSDGTSYTDEEHKAVDTPAAYEIKTPEQLYNLAWLQYMGYFNDSDEPPFYFYLSADLDMTGWVLPPIGTKEYPFVGSFDGNGYTISNLTISNRADGTDMEAGSGKDSEMPLQVKEELDRDGATDLGEEAEIIGLFGVVGEYSGSAVSSSVIASIENVKIDNISVVSKTQRCLAGLAAGYVGGSAGMEGVLVNGSIDGSAASAGVDVGTSADDMISTEKLSYYTTVGYCDTSEIVDVTHSVCVKSADFEVREADSEFGGTIDMKSLFQRLKNVYGSGKTSAAPVYTGVTANYTRSNQNAAFSLDGEIEYSGKVSVSNAAFKNFSDDWASYSFSSNSSSTYAALHGADNITSPTGSETMTRTTTYTTKNCETFTIQQNGKYLALSGTSIVAEDSEDDATLWAYVSHDHVTGGSSYLITKSGSTTYFLTIDSDLSLKVETAYASASAWTRTSVAGDYVYSSGTYYLFYDTSDGKWKVEQAEQVVNIQESYYLRNNYHYLYSDYSCDNTWKIESYLYSNEASLPYVGSVKGAKNTDYKAQWHFDNDGYLSIAADDERKYLNVDTSAGTLKIENSGVTQWEMQAADAADPSIYYLATKSASSGGTTYYLNFTWYLNSFVSYRIWKISTSTSESTTSNANGNTPKVQIIKVADGDTSAYECTQTSKNEKITYQYTITESASAVYATYDSVFPIAVNETVTGSYPSGGYSTRTESTEDGYANTGYFVGGAEQKSEAGSEPLGNIRVAGYALSTRLTASLNGLSAYADGQLEILTQTPDGQFRISDSANANNTNISSDVSGITKKTLTELGLNKTVYDAAREELADMFEADAGTIYGLHFMPATISKANVAEMPTAWINGISYDNYQMPRNSIDFMLNQSGYISFYAGTYYGNNTSFFSLHHIYRDDEDKITDIKEISRIYKDSGSYVYEYADGTYSAYSGGEYDTPVSDAPACMTDANLVFDTAWITATENLIQSAVYYFQIPANRGEYALGSTSGIGAYLFYLDICSNPNTGMQEITRTETMETVTSDTGRCPDGVGFAAVKDAAVALEFKNSAAASAVTSSDKITVTFESEAAGSGEAVAGAACVYKAADVTVMNADTQMTASTDSSESFFRTITEYNKTADTTITQTDEVEKPADGVWGIDDDWTQATVIRNIQVLNTGEAFSDIPEGTAYTAKLEDEFVGSYSYQTTTDTTVDIVPLFAYNYEKASDTDPKSVASRDEITVTSSSEAIILDGFKLSSDVNVEVKVNDTKVTSDSEIEIPAGTS